MNYLEIAKNKAKQQPQLSTLEIHDQTWKTRLTFIWALVLWQISSALPAITSNHQGHFELWKIRTLSNTLRRLRLALLHLGA